LQTTQDNLHKLGRKILGPSFDQDKYNGRVLNYKDLAIKP
jgi:hypothetical protein